MRAGHGTWRAWWRPPLRIFVADRFFASVKSKEGSRPPGAIHNRHPPWYEGGSRAVARRQAACAVRRRHRRERACAGAGYPARPIRLVGFTPGSTTDFICAGRQHAVRRTDRVRREQAGRERRDRGRARGEVGPTATPLFHHRRRCGGLSPARAHDTRGTSRRSAGGVQFHAGGESAMPTVGPELRRWRGPIRQDHAGDRRSAQSRTSGWCSTRRRLACNSAGAVPRRIAAMTDVWVASSAPFGDGPTVIGRARRPDQGAGATRGSVEAFPDAPTFVEQGFADTVADHGPACLPADAARRDSSSTPASSR